MTTPTDTRRDLLTVIARMHAKPGKEQELREALQGRRLVPPGEPAPQHTLQHRPAWSRRRPGTGAVTSRRPRLLARQRPYGSPSGVS